MALTVNSNNQSWTSPDGSLVYYYLYKGKKLNNHIKSLANGDFEVVPLDDPAFLESQRKRCHCHKCRPISCEDPSSMFMRLCPLCGNKRCPKASDHELACTNSNEPGQPGSIY